MSHDPYRLFLPERPETSAIFAVPHSGRAYPPQLMRETALSMAALRSSEDAFVDDLVADAPRCGAPLLVAQYPRAWVDLNRSADELDPALIEGVARGGLNPRIASGLGVIPRVVSGGRSIYRGKIARTEAETRLNLVWRPYHACLAGLVARQLATFGEAIVIDCHSMPHEATESFAHRRGARPDVVLGDRFGASATAEIVSRIETILEGAGLRVSRNSPFAGAYVTQHYGRPSVGQHVVQIELDRALYMDEATVTPRPDFDQLRALMSRVVAEIAAIGRRGSDALPLAAE
jgi:N-formylglutamate amidohydrolase